MTLPDEDDGRRRDQNLPVPDPTRLTTALVRQAIDDFEKLMVSRSLVVETRLSAIDQATKLVAADVARIAAESTREGSHLRDDNDRQIAALREYLLAELARLGDVAGEKFSGIDTRFVERDERIAQAAQESRISLDAALAAAKEAVSEQNKANTLAIGKSEAATQKQIDALNTLMTSGFKSIDDKIADLKTSRDAGTGGRAGIKEFWGYALGAIGLVAFILSNWPHG